MTWIVSGRLWPIALRSKPLQDLQGLEQAGSLRPRPALADGVAAVLDGDRLLDPACVGGQVACSGSARRWPAPGVDPAGDRPAVEVIGHQPQAAARGRRRDASLRGDQRRERPGEVGVPARAVALEEQQRRADDLRRRSSCRTGRAASGRRRAPRGRRPRSMPLAGMPPPCFTNYSRVASRGAAPWPAITSTTFPRRRRPGSAPRRRSRSSSDR